MTITIKDLERTNPIFAALRRLDADPLDTSPLDWGGLDRALLEAATYGPRTQQTAQILEAAIKIKTTHVNELRARGEQGAAEYHRRELNDLQYRLAEVRADLQRLEDHAVAHGLTQPRVTADTNDKAGEPPTR